MKSIRELQTLKDIEEEHLEGQTDCVVKIKDLKQEAIRWIKSRMINCVFSCREGKMICKEHRFWMDKFNITKEDLR